VGLRAGLSLGRGAAAIPPDISTTTSTTALAMPMNSNPLRVGSARGWRSSPRVTTPVRRAETDERGKRRGGRGRLIGHRG
jgi:hypothetical protein